MSYGACRGVILTGLMLLVTCGGHAANVAELVSQRSGAVPLGNGAGGSLTGSAQAKMISNDGRFVVFTSSGYIQSDVLSGNSSTQVYLFDRSNNSIRLVSVNSSGTGGGNGTSSNPVISGDGNYVAFSSSATDLVATDTNGFTDIFLFDRNGTANPKAVLISHAPGGGPAAASSSSPVINFNGQYVAYASSANNIVAGDAAAFQDIFRYDRLTDTNVLVSHRTGMATGFPNGGSDTPAISDDGNWIVYQSGATNLTGGTDANGQTDIFLFDGGSTTTTLVSHANGSANSGSSFAFTPSISANGNLIAFTSFSNNLTAGDANGQQDVFLYDRTTNLNVLASHANGSVNGGSSSSNNPMISSDGTHIAYFSSANNIVPTDNNFNQDVYLYRVVDNVNFHVSHPFTGPGTVTLSLNGLPMTSGNGRYVAFCFYYSSGNNIVPTDTNSGTFFNWDVAVYDRNLDQCRLVSRNSAGTDSSNGASFTTPAVAVDGSIVAFISSGSNIVAGTDSNSNNDVFAFATSTNTNTLLSRVNDIGQQAGGGTSLLNTNFPSRHQRTSADGRYVVFSSDAADLVPNDTNGQRDVFLRDMQSGQIFCCSINKTGSAPGDSFSDYGVVSADGRFVAFFSYSLNLTNETIFGNGDYYLYDRDSSGVKCSLVSIDTTGTTSNDGGTDEIPPSISADGRYVAFGSYAGNLTAIPTSYQGDVFIYDRLAANPKNTLVSVNAAGTSTGDSYSAGPIISADGRYVHFYSYSSDLQAIPTMGNGDLYRWDRMAAAPQNKLISRNTTGTSGGNNFSTPVDATPDGKYVLFHSSATNLTTLADPNSFGTDIFLADSDAATIDVVTISADGTQTASAGSSQLNGSISNDGRYAVFGSTATNLVAGDTNAVRDVFVFDRLAANPRNRMCSVDPMGLPGNAQSTTPAISSDGRFIAFSSTASNLVAGDTNGRIDLFIFDQQAVANPVSILTKAADGSGSSGTSTQPFFSADGSYIVFQSISTNLNPLDPTAIQDVYRLKRRLVPSIGWTNPIPILLGTALSGTQLNASVDLPGSLAYTPPASTVLAAGLGQTLSVAFTPADPQLYESGQASVTIDVASVSGPTAAPNPAQLGQPVLFQVGINLSNVTVVWDFGDGTPTRTGSAVSHQYLAPGTYNASASLTHTSGPLTTTPLTVVVNGLDSGNPNPPTQPTNTDADGDGFNNDLETALGSNPNSAASTPFNLPASTSTEVLNVAKAQLKLDFGAGGRDSVSLAGTLPIAANFVVAGQRVLLSFGGIVKNFQLDGKGKGVDGEATFTLKVKAKKGIVAAQDAKYALKMKGGTYASTLSAFDLTNGTFKNERRSVPTSLVTGGRTFNREVEFKYSARNGKATGK